jgi:hypothetical protein
VLIETEQRLLSRVKIVRLCVGRDDVFASGSRLCKNAVFGWDGWAGSSKRISCSDRFYQSADTQNAHYPFHVVGQHV